MVPRAAGGIAVRLDYLEHALRDNGRLELRHQIGERWVSGIFDEVHALRATVASLAKLGNLFTTINAPLPMKASNDMDARALRDADIGWHTRLAFDFDPVRGCGQPSTDAEVALAIVERNRLVQALRSMGWPMPATAMSGNGAHALFRCKLPVSAGTADMLRTIYTGMRSEFSTEQVLFDPTVRNPARIWRLYGTENRKGSPTPERRHRRAQVLIPDRWDPVAPLLLERLANAYARRAPARVAHAPRDPAPRPAGRGNYRTLDVRGWFAAHGAYRRELGADKHAVLCPWVHEHSNEPGPLDTSTVVWDATAASWPSFHCSHAHCAGRTIRDVMSRWRDADAYCGAVWSRESAL